MIWRWTRSFRIFRSGLIFSLFSSIHACAKYCYYCGNMMFYFVPCSPFSFCPLANGRVRHLMFELAKIATRAVPKLQFSSILNILNCRKPVIVRSRSTEHLMSHSAGQKRMGSPCRVRLPLGISSSLATSYTVSLLHGVLYFIILCPVIVPRHTVVLCIYTQMCREHRHSDTRLIWIGNVLKKCILVWRQWEGEEKGCVYAFFSDCRTSSAGCLLTLCWAVGVPLGAQPVSRWAHRLSANQMRQGILAFIFTFMFSGLYLLVLIQTYTL